MQNLSINIVTSPFFNSKFQLTHPPSTSGSPPLEGLTQQYPYPSVVLMSLHVILHHLIFISNILTHLHSKSHIVKNNPIEKLHTFSLQTPQIFSPQKLPNSKHPTLRSLHHITLSILQNPSILRFELDGTHPKGEITQTQEIKWNS